MAARPLRIAFDLSATRLADAGVVRTARALADALEARDDLELVRIGGGELATGLGRRAQALRIDLDWAPRGARAAARDAGADVLHVPYARGPLTRGRPATVITIHDLAALHHPETLSRWNRLHTRRTLPRLLAAADAVIAVSQDTADGIARLAPGVAGRVHVVPNGVAAFWGEPAAPTPARPPYVLAVGTPEPRKNLARLAAAMRLRRAAGAPEELVHVGGAGWGDGDLPDEPWIHRLGRIGDLQLRALYRGAAALAIPSLHEGSGLPVLEAFAAGAPVVAARAGALPETCGDAAVLVDPLDAQAIADGIDAAIARRDELLTAGRAIAERSTWDAAAALTAAVYRSVA